MDVHDPNLYCKALPTVKRGALTSGSAGTSATRLTDGSSGRLTDGSSGNRLTMSDSDGFDASGFRNDSSNGSELSGRQDSSNKSSVTKRKSSKKTKKSKKEMSKKKKKKRSKSKENKHTASYSSLSPMSLGNGALAEDGLLDDDGKPAARLGLRSPSPYMQTMADFDRMLIDQEELNVINEEADHFDLELNEATCKDDGSRGRLTDGECSSERPFSEVGNNSGSVGTGGDDTTSLLTNPEFDRFDEKTTMWEEFATYAGAALGVDDYNQEAPGTPGAHSAKSLFETMTRKEAVSHNEIVAYMLSMGTNRIVAERIAFLFISEQGPPGDGSGRHTPPSGESLSSAENRRQLTRAATTSKLRYIAREAEARRTALGNASDPNIHHTPTGGDGVSLESENEGNSRRSGLNYPRFMQPGAVTMSGRAFGAPLRPPDTPETGQQSETTSEHGGEERAPNGELFQAEWVTPENVVVAEKMSLNNMLRQGPVRKALCVGTLVITIAVALITYFVVTGGQSNSETEAPSMAPTSISDDILIAAVAISGPEALKDPTSPQNRAVGWLSTFDKIMDSDPDYSEDGQLFRQRYALITLYYSTQGEDWLEVDKWLDPTLNECLWSDSITCQADLSGNQIVVGLDLSRNGLQGTLPEELSLLRELEYVSMQKNDLAGTIPESLFSLGSLEILDLSSNKLSARIPSTVGAANALQRLNLADNALYGLLPMEMFDLTNLTILDLHSNDISGWLPQEYSESAILRSLDLSHNQIGGKLPSFLGLEKLDFLRLNHNILTGPLPNFPPESSRKSFTFRLEVTVSNNQLTGTFPRPEVGPPPNIVNISSADVIDDVSDITESRIQRLDYSNNMLSGTIPTVFSTMQTLKHFDVSSNQLSGQFPALRVPGLWSKLEYVSAANNQLTGQLPGELFPDSLVHYDMSNNQMSGIISPSTVCHLSSLKELLASKNRLEGSIPLCVLDLVNLQQLSLAEVGLAGAIPYEIGKLSNLVFLDLSINAVTGTLPTVLGELADLNKLCLSRNLLSGSIPTEFERLTTLEQLNLDSNGLTGTIPTLGGLSNLKNFSISENAIVGSVPAAFCSLPDLNMTAVDIGCQIGCSCCHGLDVVCGEDGSNLRGRRR